MPPMTGRVIAGRYNLQHPIGRGAMGVVWRARDQLLDRDVAIKEVVISALIGADERRNAYQRTLREARTAARLSHRGVVTVYDVVEEDSRPWIVMELVPSQSLDQLLTVEGRLPPARSGRIGQQLLSALAAAHSAGVLHRDVKPSNVLISANRTGDGWEERAVLTDFGIAQFEGDPRLTQTGMVMGSPGFTAPERIRGGDATPGSDLWSLGATLYAAVEGRGPYEQRGGAITTMSAIINEDAPVAPHAGKLAPLIAALLRRDPSTRPSASAAARMFAQVIPQLESDAAGSAAAHPETVRATFLSNSPDAAPASGAASHREEHRQASAKPAPKPLPPKPAGDKPAQKQLPAAKPAGPGSAMAESAKAKSSPRPPTADKQQPRERPGAAAAGERPDSPSAGKPAAADSAAVAKAAAAKASVAKASVAKAEAPGAASAKAAKEPASASEATQVPDPAAGQSTVTSPQIARVPVPDTTSAKAKAKPKTGTEAAADEPKSVPDTVLDTPAAKDAPDEPDADEPDGDEPQTDQPDADQPEAADPDSTGYQPTELAIPVARKPGASSPATKPAQPKTPPKPAPTFTAAKPAERATPSFSAANQARPATPASGQGQRPGYGQGAGYGYPAGGATFASSRGQYPAGGQPGQYAGPSQAYPDLARQYQPGTAGGRGGRYDRGSRRTRQLIWLVVAVLVAAAIGVGAALALNRNNGNENAASAGNSGIADTPTTFKSVNALNTPTTTLPPGWTTKTVTAAEANSVAGFTICMPPGWTEKRDGLHTDFTGPGKLLLEVDLTPQQSSNMLTAARQVESAAHLRGYKRLNLEAVPVRHTQGAVWKFNWTPAGGSQFTVDDIFFTQHLSAGRQDYAIYLRSPSSTFSAKSLPLFDKILPTFQTVPAS